MNIVTSDSLAVKENARFSGRFLPKKFTHFGALVKLLGDRAGIDSFYFRLPISGVINSQTLINAGFYGKRYGRYKFFRLLLDEDNIAVEYHRNRWSAFFEICVYSLTRFYKNRSSAVFANYRDYFAALYQLKDFINESVPLIENRFNPFSCQNSRHDQFGDLMFLNRQKGEMLGWFNQAKLMKIEGLPYTYEFEETETDRAGFGWMNKKSKYLSTEFLKIYFKESRELYRPKGAEWNPYKIRIEHSYQKPAALRDALLNDLKLFQQETYHLPDLMNRGVAYEIRNPHINNAFNLCRPEIINRLFWHRARHLFATAEIV